MNIVKVTYPGDWDKGMSEFTSWFHRQTPGISGVWDNCRFIVNEAVNECDYWLIWGYLDRPEKVIVRKKTVLLFTEEATIKKWDINFMNQFDVVVGSQININSPSYVHDHYSFTWHVKKTYDQLIAMKPFNKNKLLSIIASSKRDTAGHEKRHDFVNQLNQSFGKNVDLFGRGFNFIDDKWDGLSDYKFSVAIENQSTADYFTEKIADCFLAYTIPLYYGCPNIDKYFPKGSYVNIDINNINKAIDIIENVIYGDFYEKNFDALLEARELILKKYQFVPQITKLLNEIDEGKYSSRKIKLLPESFFGEHRQWNKVKAAIYHVLLKKQKI